MCKSTDTKMTTLKLWAIKDTDKKESTYGDLLPLSKPEVYANRASARTYVASYRKHKIPCCTVRVTLSYES